MIAAAAVAFLAVAEAFAPATPALVNDKFSYVFYVVLALFFWVKTFE
jgi:hypothetical protein